MTYPSRTATTGDPIAITFAKLIDYPAISDSQFGLSTPIFFAGHHTDLSNEPSTITSNMPTLWSTSYADDGGAIIGLLVQGVSHGDYGDRQAGLLTGDNNQAFDKEGCIDRMYAGLNRVLTDADPDFLGGSNGSFPTVAITFQRQALGDFTDTSTVSKDASEATTHTFEDYLSNLYTSFVGASLASTTSAPEALFVTCVNYYPGSTQPQDRVGAFKLAAAGDMSFISLFKTDYGDNRNTTILAQCRDATNHYFVHEIAQDALDQSTWGCVTICSEGTWPSSFSYTNYTAKFDDADLPDSLGELITDAVPATYKFTSIYGTDQGFLISYKKYDGAAWQPKFVLVDKQWTTVRHITATSGDATATSILSQGVGNDSLSSISMMTDATYWWMIGGTPDVPLIVESTATVTSPDETPSPGTPTLNAWGFRLDNHRFYVIPSVGLVYDLETGQWSEWINEGLTRLRANVGQNWAGMTGSLTTYGADIVAGDDTTGVLWIFDPTVARDDRPDSGDEAFTRIVTSMVPANGRETIPCNAVELTCALGDPSQTGATITLETSDDRGQTWLNHGAREMVAGDFNQVIEWRGLGVIRQPGRIFRWTDDGATVSFLRCEMR